jgi:hypothetical protein
MANDTGHEIKDLVYFCMGRVDLCSAEEVAQGIKDKLQDKDKDLFLEIPEFQLVYDILKDDDITGYKAVCNGLSVWQKQRLANAHFRYLPEYKALNHVCQYEALFILSAALGAKRCIGALVQNGVDLFQIDPTARANWVHAIIESATESPELEEEMVEVYKMLMQTTPQDGRRGLLLMENEFGFRPIELASKCAMFRIVKAILETNGVYMEVTGSCGLQTYVKYRFPEYEPGSPRKRYIRSPLLFMTSLKSCNQASLRASKILQMRVMKEWLECKYKRCRLLLFTLLFLKLLYVAVLLYFDPVANVPEFRAITPPNDTSVYHRSSAFETDTYAAILIFIALASGIGLLTKIILLIMKFGQPDYRKVFGWDLVFSVDYLAKTDIYGVVDFFLYSCALVCYSTASDLDTAVMFKCIILPLSIISAMSCLEIIPTLGVFVITFRKMIIITAKFILLNALLTVTFATFFHDITYKDPNSHFKNFTQSHYSIFKLEQSMFGFGSDPQYSIQFAHMFFYFLTVVLLMNYLIAVLSEAVTSLADIKDDVMTLRRLEESLELEDCFFWRLNWLIKKFGLKIPNCLKPQSFISVKRTSIHRSKPI